MSVFSLFHKKKKGGLELPPPPKILPVEQLNDISDVNVGEKLDEIPEPPLPKRVEPQLPDDILFEKQMPEFPSLPSEDFQDVSVAAPTASSEEQLTEKNSNKEENVVFDKTVNLREEKPVEIIHKKMGSYKTFVSLDDYSTISHSADIVNDSLAEAESLVRRLNQLRIEENKTVDKWLYHLEDMEKKLSHIDKMLARAQS